MKVDLEKLVLHHSGHANMLHNNGHHTVDKTVGNWVLFNVDTFGVFCTRLLCPIDNVIRSRVIMSHREIASAPVVLRWAPKDL